MKANRANRPNICFSEAQPKARSLTTLKMNGLHVSSLREKAFLGLSSLLYLQLKDTRISHLADKVFQKLSNLKQLDLSHNLRLLNLPHKVFSGMKNLQKLNLSGSRSIFKTHYWCEETDFNAEKNMFAELPELTVLDLSKTGFNPWSDSKMFARNTKLQELRITDNNMQFITNSMIDTFKSLSVLDMRNIHLVQDIIV